MSDNQKKAGRPKGNPERKAVKPNISLRRDLIAEAEAAAAKRGMGLSEYTAMALLKQVARDENPDAAHVPLVALVSTPEIDEAKSCRSGGL